MQASIRRWMVTMILTTVAGIALGDTHYVRRDNPTPVSPYESWETAATNIQDAVDVAGVGATVLVSNGVYDAGGKWVTYANYSASNRVYVGAAITLRSVNGPAETFIQGAPDPDTGTNGPAATRCVMLRAGASLIGFTLTNGFSATGHADWQRIGGGVWLYHASSLVSNCVIVGNHSARSGGGVYLWAGTVVDCVITGNSAAGYGAGICCSGRDFCLIDACIITNNHSILHGGGVAFLGKNFSPTTLMQNCVVVGNRATGTGNSSLGGGIHVNYCDGTVRNCLIASNMSGGHGAGIFLSGAVGTGSPIVENCTIVDNGPETELYGSGGIRIDTSGAVTNCIVWGNRQGNFSINAGASVSYSCSDPKMTGWPGEGNIGDAPRFVDAGVGNYRLKGHSPCVNTGTNLTWLMSAKDLDGKLRIRYGTVDMGAYETLYQGAMISIR